MVMSDCQLSQKLTEEVQQCSCLLDMLVKVHNLQDRIKILNQSNNVRAFLLEGQAFFDALESLPLEDQYLIKAVIAIGQGEVVFGGKELISFETKDFKDLLTMLQNLEKFYDTIGGIIGYHLTVIRLILEQQKPSEDHRERYRQPSGLDIFHADPEVYRAERHGIEYLPLMAEMYPIGGAGDRLRLHDEITGEPLPTAMLPFCGRNLLLGLFRDLQAREYLFYKLFGGQLVTPVAMMTSHEKDNYFHVQAICDQEQWFGRPRESIRFFIQSSVPVISKSGEWMMDGPIKPMLKPGGHGVIWKLAIDSGIISWFEELGRKKALVRQINNPVAGTDNGLLAFTGLGCHENKQFGFASCFRRVNAAEGMNVLRERFSEGKYYYAITNIEYTDFKKKKIVDAPIVSGGEYSPYPANTNILFVDFEAVKEALKRNPIPGMIINMKSLVRKKPVEGGSIEVEGGRLESTMQNIADSIEDCYAHEITKDEENNLKTFLTFNNRLKTISVTKNGYQQGGRVEETPEGCYYEVIQNYYDLLTNYCHVQTPTPCSREKYLSQGPSFIALFHPAIGPLYNVIAQKIRKGVLSEGSELQLEIAEVDIANLHLEGSLLIEAQDPLGQCNEEGVITYSEDGCKCTLNNVRVKNLGIDRGGTTHYWKNEIVRHEAVRIILHGNAEFFAENVTFCGDHYIEVPSGYRVVAIEDGGEIQFHREEISGPTWHWEYTFGSDDRINLKRCQG